MGACCRPAHSVKDLGSFPRLIAPICRGMEPGAGTLLDSYPVVPVVTVA